LAFPEAHIPENAMRNLPRRRLPLATVCLALFAASADMAFAAPLPVSNCNDHGSGSLRAAIASAVSGDTVDIPSNLGCSKISLTTGALAVTQDNLAISGPGAANLTITGKYTNSVGSSSTEHYRIVTHTGNGKLEISGLTLSKGYLVTTGGTPANGGCVYSAGILRVENSAAVLCTAKSDIAYSAGGALFAKKGMYVGHSKVSYNTADSGSGSSSGGGIAAENYLIAKYDTISFNTAGNSTTHKGNFGGFLAVHNGAAPSSMLYNIIGSSTISHNYASQLIGGGGVVGTVSTLIDNVTVANNTTVGDVGGLYLQGLYNSVANSTIAFNTAGTNAMAAGVQFRGYSAGAKVNLYSTIASNNYVGAGPAPDVGASNVTVTGSNNLVRFPGTTMPQDTLGACPLLAPLDDYGGDAQTIKLLGRSPAIDRGNNVVPDLNFDGRGPGFPRSSGPPHGSAVPDIGAYEVNRADEIFDNTFDAGCPAEN
jgi:hypothetical protein